MQTLSPNPAESNQECCDGATQAMATAHELAEGVTFEIPSASDVDAMLDTEEAAELVEA